MAIKSFIFALLSIAILSYFVPIKTDEKKESNEEKVLLTFNDATMYTLTPISMNRVIYAKKALRYKTKDVMHEGALTLKGKDNEGKEITDLLYSDLIIKRGDDFKFLNNVKFRRDDFLNLNTNELLYNSKNRIAKNTLPFDGTYFNNYIKGENIYLDMNKYFMKSDNTHFEIEIQKN